MFCFCLSKPQAWYIIAAQRAVYIIKGGEPPLYLITRQRAFFLRLDDIQHFVLVIYNATHWWYTRLRRDWDARSRKALEFPWKIWYNTLKEVIWNEESKYFTTYSLHLFVDWQYYKSVEFIDRDSICTLCLYRSTSLNIGDFIHYRPCQTDKNRKKQKEIILVAIIGHLLFVITLFRHLLSRLRQKKPHPTGWGFFN